jgi:hypothetical protein
MDVSISAGPGIDTELRVIFIDSKITFDRRSARGRVIFLGLINLPPMAAAESTTWLDRLSLLGHSREQASRSTLRDPYLSCEESEDCEGNAIAAIHQGSSRRFVAQLRRCLITLGDYRYSTQRRS